MCYVTKRRHGRRTIIQLKCWRTFQMRMKPKFTELVVLVVRSVFCSTDLTIVEMFDIFKNFAQKLFEMYCPEPLSNGVDVKFPVRNT